MPRDKTRQGSTSPGRPRSEAADTAILSAALDLLIELGAGAVSVEGVAQRAGVTRPTIYRRFKDKTQLLVAALEFLIRSAPSQRQPRDVEEMIAAWAGFLSVPRMRLLTRRLFGSVDDYPELQRVYREKMRGPAHAIRLRLIEKARVEGHLPPNTDPNLLLEVLSGAVWYHLAEYPDDTDAEACRAYLMAVLGHAGYRNQTDQGDPNEQ